MTHVSTHFDLFRCGHTKLLKRINIEPTKNAILKGGKNRHNINYLLAHANINKEMI